MTNTKPTITSAEPQLFVSDIASSCAFFADKLGFAVVFIYGEPPFYALVKRGGASLTLRHARCARDRSCLARSRGIAVGLADGRDAGGYRGAVCEYQANGVTFFQELKDEPWGARDFIVSDIDGNLLLFAGPGK